MAWGLMFSGQGMLHGQMLPWLARDATLARVEDEFGEGWRADLDRDLQQPGRTLANRRAQWLLTGTGCAAWQQLKDLLPPPVTVAGYSVGELAAFSAAGVFEPVTALQLADARAACMDAAVAGHDTGLLAVSGAVPDALEAWRLRHDLDCAIRIDPGSAVMGGLRSALSPAAAEAGQQGWRTTPLDVSLASHTRWMSDAIGPFDQVLAAVPMQRPSCALFTNALGRVRQVDDARRALSAQLARTVRWDACMDAFAAQGVQAVLEIGPGSSLARMWNERFDGRPARSADEFRSVDAIVRWLERVGTD
jgi:[acyl-carrier-protein] S-malonyltransferase